MVDVLFTIAFVPFLGFLFIWVILQGLEGPATYKLPDPPKELLALRESFIMVLRGMERGSLADQRPMAMMDEWASALVTVAREEGWEEGPLMVDQRGVYYLKIRKAGVSHRITVLTPDLLRSFKKSA